MALDTATAAAAADGVETVLVVVEDPTDGDRLAQIAGVRIHHTQTRDLNGAILDGLSVLAARFRGPVAALPGDLPSLTAHELGLALAAAEAHPVAVVADRQGTGTTLLTARSATDLRPQYGLGSLRRHLTAGAVPLELPARSGLRRDVDNLADLSGITGSNTVAVLAGAGCGHQLCAARPTG